MNRKISRMVGILFIIGTVSGILSLTAANMVNAPDYLVKISENRNMVILGALFVLIMGISLSMMSVLLYPVIKKYNEALALGAVIFRGALELVTYMVVAMSWLLLLTLSQEFVLAGTSVPYYQLMGNLLRDVISRNASMMGIVFSIGALIIYNVFYKTKLVPPWLSLWGFMGGILYLAYPILFMFDYDIGILQMPLCIQEMIMAGWLIIKGFNPSAYESLMREK